jgi:hypothetical protein
MLSFNRLPANKDDIKFLHVVRDNTDQLDIALHQTGLKVKIPFGSSCC